MIIILGSALLWGLLFFTAAAFVWAFVAEIMQERMKSHDAEKGMVIGNEEMDELVDTMKTKNPKAARKLQDMRNAKQKVTMYETKSGNYAVEGLNAKNKDGRDDFEYGGVVFDDESGWVYDANGNRVRMAS